jgi:hypothetical protein
MKLEKPDSKGIANGIAQVGGATLGFIIPNGIGNVVAKVDDDATATDDQKKTKMYVNLACLIGGVTLSLMVKGDDVIANSIKGAGYGLAGGAAKGLIAEVAKDKITSTTPKGVSQRFIKGALGCGCNPATPSYQTLNRPITRRLAMPDVMVDYKKANSIEENVVVDPLG